MTHNNILHLTNTSRALKRTNDPQVDVESCFAAESEQEVAL